MEKCEHDWRLFHDSKEKECLTFFCKKCLKFVKKQRPIKYED